MTHYKKVLYILLLTAKINADASVFGNACPKPSSYQQTNPEILKNINLENPTTHDQQMIISCQLVEHYGRQLAPAPDVNWESIKSVQLISEILPRLHRTHTTFGYLALVQQCTQMTSNINQLSNKTALTTYFDTNTGIASKLNKVIKQSAPALETYLNLCKTHNDEELANQDTVNSKLYYTSRLGSHLNENGLALGFWTRANQLWTLAIYTFPTLLYSNMHKIIKYHDATQNAMHKKLDFIDQEHSLFASQTSDLKKLVQEIDDLEKFIEENPTFAQKAYNDLISNIKTIDEKKQTTLEKTILETPVFNLIPIIFNAWSTSKFEVLKYLGLFTTYLSKHFTIDGTLNAPAYYADSAQKLTKELKRQYNENPIYNHWKNNLTQDGWNKDEIKTKAVATTMTTASYSVIGLIYATYPFILYRRYQSTKELFDLVANKQKDLVQIAHVIKSLQHVHHIIEHDATLKSLIPEHKKLAQLFNQSSQKTSPDLKSLIQTLLSSSFAEESYYLSQQGKILATHHLFMRIKHELVPYLEAFGYIDAYLSTYKLYAEFKNHPNARICLPEFKQHDTPQILIQDFWHPLINPYSVVTNSLDLGINDSMANLMITGPNAGGKTTSLMALIINIILAQAYGIATATNLSFTPVTKIHSYLDITTNLLDGESLFKAEVNRSKKLKESILSCLPGEKTFTIIDELFTGTNPEVASNVGFKFGEILGAIPHSMCIITTHFPRLTELPEATGRFTNYKVADAHIAPNGTITYPFKLEIGKSTQNIAQHMLEQEGII